MRNIFIVGLFIITFIAGAVFTSFYSKISTKSQIKNNFQEACDYTFINPLRCAADAFTPKSEYMPFRDSLSTYLEELTAKGDINKASVYFRDLESGPTFTINGNEIYYPASLLKVPIMLSYLKHSESDTSLLTKRVEVGKLTDYPEDRYYSGRQIEEGKSYTVEELIEYMIKDSDNNAKDVLMEYSNQADSTFVADAFIDLGMLDVDEYDKEIDLNVHEYASIFRILYNASYLSPEVSEKALKLLTTTAFKDGIVSGVPEDVIVAHKFGIRELETDFLQLHDCGIVYYPQTHYLLCVMTRGKNIENLAKTIQTISEKVYQEVSLRDSRE